MDCGAGCDRTRVAGAHPHKQSRSLFPGFTFRRRLLRNRVVAHSAKFTRSARQGDSEKRERDDESTAPHLWIVFHNRAERVDSGGLALITDRQLGITNSIGALKNQRADVDSKNLICRWLYVRRVPAIESPVNPSIIKSSIHPACQAPR